MPIVIAFVSLSAILLLLDWNNRSAGKPKELKQIAIFKISSRLLLEDTEQGVLEALSANGYIDGDNCRIVRYCAEGDMPTANTIAQTIVNQKFDIVITVSTPALQIMANANRDGKLIHVFGAVTDPYISGVGITGTEPRHPPLWHVLSPLKMVLKTASNEPTLKKVGRYGYQRGLFQACIRARKNARTGIVCSHIVENPDTLLKRDVAHSPGVVKPLARGDIGRIGHRPVAEEHFRSQIPHFTYMPRWHGNLLFALGANYSEVGLAVGSMAAKILNGANPAHFSVNNVVPDKLIINTKALNNINRAWNIDKFKQQAIVH